MRRLRRRLLPRPSTERDSIESLRNLCKSPVSYSEHACTARQIDWRGVFVCEMSLSAKSIHVSRTSSLAMSVNSSTR